MMKMEWGRVNVRHDGLLSDNAVWSGLLEQGFRQRVYVIKMKTEGQSFFMLFLRNA